MTDVAALPAPEGGPTKPRPRGLLIGGLLALLLGGAGFGVVYLGLLDPAALLRGGFGAGDHAAGGHTVAGGPAFVPLDPITISLAPGNAARHLRFTAQIETPPEAAAAVAALTPRIVDALNTYLRAVEVTELEEPAALPRLRAGMLRRVRLAAGDDQISDLLITEFVLN